MRDWKDAKYIVVGVIFDDGIEPYWKRVDFDELTETDLDFFDDLVDFREAR